jgi:hypothetical protein
MVSIALKVRHDHCSHCQQPDRPLYLLDITAGEPLTIRPSDTHAGLCASCIVTLGVSMVEGVRLLQPVVSDIASDITERESAVITSEDEGGRGVEKSTTCDQPETVG